MIRGKSRTKPQISDKTSIFSLARAEMTLPGSRFRRFRPYIWPVVENDQHAANFS